MNVLQIVDSVSYVNSNCFQHQLNEAFLASNHNITTITISDVQSNTVNPEKFDSIVSRLKLRTLYNNIEQVTSFLKNSPVTVYDQDPWEAFRIGSPYLGAYHKINDALNVKKFAVTTKWWADYISDVHGMPSQFVKMWVLPRYCKSGHDFIEREIKTGFIGTVHSYRQKLFDFLERNNKSVTIVPGSKGYEEFLRTLRKMRVFIHDENIPIELMNLDAKIGETKTNIGNGLWIKDVEACSQGCFSVRNKREGFETYLEGIKTVRLYDDISEVPDILNEIQDMGFVDRQLAIDETVKFIKEANFWTETVELLVS